jgi:hypothetical protein
MGELTSSVVVAHSLLAYLGQMKKQLWKLSVTPMPYVAGLFSSGYQPFLSSLFVERWDLPIYPSIYLSISPSSCANFHSPRPPLFVLVFLRSWMQKKWGLMAISLGLVWSLSNSSRWIGTTSICRSEYTPIHIEVMTTLLQIIYSWVCQARLYGNF